VLRGRPAELLDALPDPPRGEIVLVFSPLGRDPARARRRGDRRGGSEEREPEMDVEAAEETNREHPPEAEGVRREMEGDA
jgi:hypothetical protein